MRKTEFNFFVKVKSGPRTPLDIEVDYSESGIRKSMYIFGSDFTKPAIGNMIEELLIQTFRENKESLSSYMNNWMEKNE